MRDKQKRSQQPKEKKKKKKHTDQTGETKIRITNYGCRDKKKRAEKKKKYYMYLYVPESEKGHKGEKIHEGDGRYGDRVRD